MSTDYKIREIWAQLKSVTSIELKKALDKDQNWILIKTDGSRHYYENKDRPKGRDIVQIHVHPSNTGGYRNESMLKSILDLIDWTKEEMLELKLIKLKGKK